MTRRQLWRWLGVAVVVVGLSLLFVIPSGTMDVTWEGGVDPDMMHQARADIHAALMHRDRVLRVELMSTGGSALESFEIARMVRDAYEQSGLIVEIHARGVCASGCTFILAAGTPGHRYIDRYTVFLVHSMQTEDGCASYVANPETQKDKLNDTLLRLARDGYARYTGAETDVVERWLTCGQESVGRGELARHMGFADFVE